MNDVEESPPLWGVGRDPDHAVTGPTLVFQVLLVLVPVVAALGISRWWALRTTSARDGRADATYVLH